MWAAQKHPTQQVLTIFSRLHKTERKVTYYIPQCSWCRTGLQGLLSSFTVTELKDTTIVVFSQNSRYFTQMHHLQTCIRIYITTDYWVCLNKAFLASENLLLLLLEVILPAQLRTDFNTSSSTSHPAERKALLAHPPFCSCSNQGSQILLPHSKN